MTVWAVMSFMLRIMVEQGWTSVSNVKILTVASDETCKLVYGGKPTRYKSMPRVMLIAGMRKGWS